MRHTLRAVLASMLLAAVAAGCSSDSGPSAASRAAFVEARAKAMCTVKTHNYASEADLDAAFVSAQKSDIPAQDEKQLRDMLDSDSDLNREISDRVDKLCG